MARTARTTKLGLVFGYLGLLLAVLVAHGAPATRYELSLYAATPPLTWVGLGVALLVAVFVILGTDHASRGHDAALVLAAAAALTVLTLPIIRGYAFYGAGDALSHVGWAREIALGSLSPTQLLYPGIHSLTVAVAAVAGVPLPQANLYVVLFVFPLLYLLFVPLTAWLVAGRRAAFGVGLLVAVLFTPINNVAVHPIAHPASQTILFVPFVLFLALRYVARTGHGADSTTPARSAVTVPDARAQLRDLPGSAVGVVLATTAAGVVLFHPQQALNVALCFAAITTLQVGARRWASDGTIAGDRPLHLQTAIVVLAFLAWAPRFPRVRGAVVSTVSSILGQGATTGDVVTAKSASITTIGGSIGVIFTKLFLPALVCSILAGALVLYAIRGRLRDRHTTAFVRYLAILLVPMFAVFLVVLASSAGDMYFRYQGFIMVPVAILAAVALVGVRDWLGTHTTPRAATVLLVVLFLVLVPAGLVATHATPYMYQPTQHVPESQLEGYAAAFEHRDPGVEFSGLRGGPERYVDFHYGTERARTTLEFPGYKDAVGEAAFRNTSFVDSESPNYLVVTSATYEREVDLYRGFRYPERGFHALEHTPRVNRVRSNDDLDLYYVAGSPDA